MKSALALVLLAATTASIGCGGGAAFVAAAKPPVIVCTPPNMLTGGVCTAPPPAPTASLSVNPGTINKGGSTTLTWQTSNATDASIDGVAVQLNGSEGVTPTDSTTYTLTAKGAGGTQKATAMVTVTTPPPVPKHYLIVDLVPIPGANNAQANAISGGHAAGYSAVNGVIHATLWENGSVEDLGVGVAYAVNNLDEATGYVSEGNGIFHASLWSHDGTVSDLLTLNGFDSSLASGINDSGTIVGVSFSSQNLGNQAGFRWTASTGMQAIDGAATATSVSRNGDASGMTTDSRAAIFTAEGKTINLGTLGDFSIATSLNDIRHAVGYSPTQSGGPVHAFFYNGVLQDLGTIQPGSNTVASSVNNADIVVGSSNLAGHSLPFVWSETTGMEDLNTLISDPAWTLVTATSIDQNGRIVGAGSINGQFMGSCWCRGTKHLGGFSKPFCARFPPKIRDGFPDSPRRICTVTIETTSCAVDAEGHSNATV